jgi:DNA-binding NarL/FixJ family response regulator
MKCMKCGAWTNVSATRKADDWTVKRTRTCGNGHRTTTFEVTSAVWGGIRGLNAGASRAAARRAALFVRDTRILAALASGKPGHEVAKHFNLAPNSISAVKRRHQPKEKS